MAFARKRGAIWYACWTDESGRAIQRSTKARTKTEARRLADELERKARRVRLGVEDAAPEAMTLKEVADRYLRLVTAGQRSGKGTEGRIRLHILPALGSRPIHAIRPADVEALLAQMEQDGYAEWTRRHVRKHLRAMFDFARRRLRATGRDNPVDEVPQVKVARRTPRFLTPSQVEALLQAAGEWRLLLLTAVLAGLRKGELCGLRWEDVDLERRVLWVRRSYDTTTKSDRERVAAIHHHLAVELEQARKSAASPWVFPAPDGGMRRHFDAASIVRTCLKRAGLVEGYRLVCRRHDCGYRSPELAPTKLREECPDCRFMLWPIGVPLAFTLKDLRSTFGTLGYEASGDIRAIQTQLGHADIRTTEAHYSALRVAHLVAAVDRIQFGSPASDLPGTKGEKKRN
jgi:integrase